MKTYLYRIYWLTIVSIVAAVTASAQNGNGTAYFNVMSPPYNALCNGVTDDRLAIQRALDDAKAAGGDSAVLIPISTQPCVILSALNGIALNMDSSSGISLTGPPGGNSGPSGRKGALLFKAGGGVTLISMRSTAGISIKNLNLQYDNPGFTGTFIDMSAVPGGVAFSQEDYIADCSIGGTGPTNPAVSANPLIKLDPTIDTTIERNTFFWAVNAIQGQQTVGDANHFANGIRIRDNLFSGWGTNSISGIMILGMGTGWVIDGNTFEMTGSSGSYPIPIDGWGVGCSGCQISGNLFLDATPQFTNALIVGEYQGTSISGNWITGVIGGSSQTVGMALGGSSSGVSITGNSFRGLALGIYYPTSTTSNVLISGNDFTGTPQAFSGTPQSGIVTDPSGITYIYGTLQKSAGSFTIDHPLDPLHKNLSHSFVESPDMMNIYNGVIRLDGQGRATVKLPDYFETLNQDFRYQLTPVGAFAPVYVAQKIKGNSFRIAGGKPGMEISWQVTGIRHDDYANAHRIIVEEDKPFRVKGPLNPPAVNAGQIPATSAEPK